MKTAVIVLVLALVGTSARAIDTRLIDEAAGEYEMGTAEDAIGTPVAIAADADGNVYIADANNHRTTEIRKDGRIESFSPGFDIFTCFLAFDAGRLIGFGQQPPRTLQVLDLATRQMVFDIRAAWEDSATKRRMDDAVFFPTLIAGDLILSENPDKGGYSSLQFFPGRAQEPVFRGADETKSFLQGKEARSRKLVFDKNGVLISDGKPLARISKRILDFWNSNRRDRLAEDSIPDLSWPQTCFFDRFGNFYSWEDGSVLGIRNKKGDLVRLYGLRYEDDANLQLVAADPNATVYILAYFGGSRNKFVLYRIPRAW